MPSIPFNGVIVSYEDPSSQGSATILKVRSHSEAGNERPDIDVTTATDTRRVVTPGLATPQKHTFEVVVGTAAERATVLGWLAECTASDLTVSYTACTDSQPTQLFQVTAWCTGVQYSGELDGSWIYSVEFTVSH